jgi:hypothetical protein
MTLLMSCTCGMLLLLLLYHHCCFDILVLLNILHCSVHACSELGSLHSNALKSFTVGLDSNVIAVKAMYPSHKVVAIVGHGKWTSTY